MERGMGRDACDMDSRIVGDARVCHVGMDLCIVGMAS